MAQPTWLETHRVRSAALHGHEHTLDSVAVREAKEELAAAVGGLLHLLHPSWLKTTRRANSSRKARATSVIS